MSVQRRCRHQILISDGDRGKIGNRGLTLGFRKSTVIAAEHLTTGIDISGGADMSDEVIRRHFMDEIDAVGFAEEWASAHKERLGGWGSSTEWIDLSDNKDGRVLAFWFKGQLVGTATVLRDEFNETDVVAAMAVDTTRRIC